jgi:hypothetical protein
MCRTGIERPAAGRAVGVPGAIATVRQRHDRLQCRAMEVPQDFISYYQIARFCAFRTLVTSGNEIASLFPSEAHEVAGA